MNDAHIADCVRCGGAAEIKGRWCIPCYDALVAAHARQFVRTHIDGTPDTDPHLFLGEAVSDD